MNFEKAKEKLRKIDWYMQGSAAKRFYLSCPWYSCSLMKIVGKKVPVKFEINIFLKDYFMDVYISKRSLVEVAKYYLKKQKQDHSFINRLFENWHKKYVKRFLALNAEILKKDLSLLSDRDLLKEFDIFTKTYVSVWHECIFLDGFDYEGEKIIEDVLEKEKNITSEKAGILLSPPVASFLQKERLETLDIAEKILSDKKTLAEVLKNNYPIAIKHSSWLKNGLENMSHKYHWLHNDYGSIDYLGPEYFYKNLLLLLKNKNYLKGERKLRAESKNLNRNKKRIIKENKLSKEFVNITNFLALLGNFRDERKTYSQMAGNVLEKFAREFSRRTGLNLENIEELFFWEIKDIFKNKEYLRKKIKERKKDAFYFTTAPDKYIELIGGEALKLNEFAKNLIIKQKELRGKPAFKGLVEGMVKIIKDKKDFHKMAKGDILVAPNTRPEFVPVMKMAGAIITDEGGITCHAAIVSRELKIPAVVGVQGATLVLKDGDLVEVDADNGAIKIIKKYDQSKK